MLSRFFKNVSRNKSLIKNFVLWYSMIIGGGWGRGTWITWTAWTGITCTSGIDCTTWIDSLVSKSSKSPSSRLISTFDFLFFDGGAAATPTINRIKLMAKSV